MQVSHGRTSLHQHLPIQSPLKIMLLVCMKASLYMLCTIICKIAMYLDFCRTTYAPQLIRKSYEYSYNFILDAFIQIFYVHMYIAKIEKFASIFEIC